VSSDTARRSAEAPSVPRPRTAARATVVLLLGSGGAAALAAVLVLTLAGTTSRCEGPVADGGWTARSRACFVPSGFHPAEFDAGAERHFSWTGASAALRFPRLDRSRAYRLTLDVGPGRPSGIPLPTVRVAVDGMVLANAEPNADRMTVSVDIPRRKSAGALVTLDVSPTFTPGAHDTRSLGVIVDDVVLTPDGGRFRPAAGEVARAALAVALAAAGFFLCGMRIRAAATASAAVAVAFAWLLSTDAAFVGDYVDRLVRIGAATGLAGAVLGLVAVRWRPSGIPEWPAAAVVVLCATAIKLALFGHPLAQIGDAIFQVHRAQEVHAGRYFFTSVTPKPFFEFPYPVALYVAAQPFWNAVRGELGLAFLLRAVTLVADGSVGVGLYAAARRQWADGRVALCCTVLWTVARAPIESVSYANLTNAFGQAVFGLAMTALAWLAAGPAVAAALVLACALLVVAFLSHFSTISIGLPILGAAAAALLTLGRGDARRAGTLVVVLTLLAGAVSYGVYYSHFNAVYRQTLSRLIEGEQTPVAASKLVASPAVKLQRWWNSSGDDYGRPGVPMIVAAAAGVALLILRRRRQGLTLVLLSWMLVWIALTALGIFTPVSMRLNLAAAPAFVALAGFALGSLARSSRAGAAAAAVAVLLIGADALRVCLACLGRLPGWLA
jgi:hypothetical protein